ncbi:MAG: hypothetical protein A2900_05200 [Candidatus Chisholmbacteria bacterium RIFCSPLOWO2_01_FULL_50_28]|uniref:Uncharacterized protein n=1 Tax=Candidatus Chisholmbacteria bacterium RIFCSPHIGHO2_01_FULL_52_32 TaxID=1797591 RepID=A0A1G1VS09_9BACT|nr:MAG: hypothetical protein A2786_01545 [Candidatus Chisholmbacteria bacterium RIFCSPHIGHO2_01_FULL_52_32]OGY20445.1 MAG: hypothetical protein A2900_05200 [Candidatus Chisholmbacteria bacterium RIFCSPLOWO2_01_FULL_50_28]
MSEGQRRETTEVPDPVIPKEDQESLPDQTPKTWLERAFQGNRGGAITGSAETDQAAFETRKKALMHGGRISQESQSSKTPDRAPARRQGR